MRLFDAAAWMDTRSLTARLFEAAEGVCTDPICQVEALEAMAMKDYPPQAIISVVSNSPAKGFFQSGGIFLPL